MRMLSEPAPSTIWGGTMRLWPNARRSRSVQCHDCLGVVLNDLGRRGEAMAEFKTSIALDPGIYTNPHNV